MAIGKITGPMLNSNLDRQGTNLAIDANLVYFDVNNRYVGINTTTPSYALDNPGNARLANITITGNTITSNTGKINLGSITNLVVTGGAVDYVVSTDGSGNMTFIDANTVPAIIAINANLGSFQGFGNANIGAIYNRVGSLEANVGAYEIYANANIGTLYLGNISTNANLGAFQTYANANIGDIFNRTGALESNVGAFEIYSNANVGSIFNRVGTLEANVGAYEIYANANIGSIFNRVGTIEANVGAYEIYANANIGSIYNRTGSLEANVGAFEIYSNANVGAIYNRVGTLEANVGAYETWANINIGTLNANVTAANVNIDLLNANVSAANLNIADINANLGSYQTFANTTLSTIQANVGAFETYANLAIGSITTGANANTAAYLSTYSGNISAGNVMATLHGNVVGATGSFSTLANVGNLGVDGTSVFTGNINAGNIFLTGNINATVGAVASSNGIFYGNAAGFGALYTGISSGFVIQPQTIIQASSNFNGYAQINMQNINAGSQASSDYIATADNGTAGDTYIDMGIASSNYNFGGFGIIKPNDGYILVQGNTVTGGGNLVLTSGLNDIVFAPGGSNANNEVMRVTAANVVAIKSTVVSTAPTSGALTVAGGAGVSGNIFVGDYLVGNVIGTVANITTVNSTVINSGNVNAGNVNANIYGNFYTSAISGNVGLTGNLYVSGPIMSLPVGTTAQQPGGAVPGAIRYNSTLNSVEFFNGSQWISVINGITEQIINGDGVTTSFALNQSVPNSYDLLVSINGVVQNPSAAYSVVGGDIVFVEPPQDSDVVDVRFLTVTLEYDHSQLATFIGNITITGNITPAANAYTLGNVTNQWSSVYASTVYAGNVTLSPNGFVNLASYTKTQLAGFTGQIGWIAAVSNSTPAGRLAFWDGTNARWSYVSDNTAV
jgi:hypothetical protein